MNERLLKNEECMSKKKKRVYTLDQGFYKNQQNIYL